MRLQQTAGNRAVAALALQRDPESPGLPAPPRPVVPAVPDPVAITPLPAGALRVAALPRTRFSGLATVTEFAEALAAQYSRRVAQGDLVEQRRNVAERRTGRSLAAQPGIPGESREERRRRISREAQAARNTIPTPARGDDAAWKRLREDYRTHMLKDLTEDWDQHIAAAEAQSMPAHTLANTWMVNRNQELLFRLVQPSRPPGSLDMWTHFRVMSPAQEEAAFGTRASTDYDPWDLQIRPRPRGAQFVTERTAQFLMALRSRFSDVRWTTRVGHGSPGFVNRGLSLDLYLTGERGANVPLPGLRGDTFWVRGQVVELFNAMDEAAEETDFRFAALYNDFSAANAANNVLRRGRVGFAGNVSGGGSLNYHGGGNRLHVHVDLVPGELVVLTRQGARRQGAR
ncbi:MULTISPECIES: hypothetical protein [Amycolatopsis]|uniref:hypothetical protein n=1 Tax=Amycolatopsis TaxID=1813 RepID=UPI001749A585|nr:hypothetical protein [Amycolatopsis bullii]